MSEKSSTKSSVSSGSAVSFYSLKNESSSDSQNDVRADISNEGKNKLKRLGKLYSDDGSLSSPVNSRTELNFGSELSLPTPSKSEMFAADEKSRSDVEEPRRNLRMRHATSRFAALANQINNFEDDMRHFDFNTKDKKSSSLSIATTTSSASGSIKSTSSNAVSPVKRVESKKRESPRTRLSSGNPKSIVTKPSPKRSSPRTSVINANTYDKKKNTVEDTKRTFQAHVIGSSPKKTAGVVSSQASKWDKSILADLESKGFKRVSVSQSRLVYDFSPSNHLQGDKPTPASNMPAVAAVTTPSRSPRNNITKRPSIKKHKAPAPPKQNLQNGDHEKENGVSDNCESSEEIDKIVNGKCENIADEAVAKQESTCSTPELGRSPRSLRSFTSTSSSNRSSPLSRDRRMADNSNVNGSPGGNVISKAAIFETAASPRNTDPALMSMRERKALFEKNKGTAIIPKAAFGMAPPIKALQHNSNDKAIAKKPIVSNVKPRVEPRPLEIAPTHAASTRAMVGLLQPTLSGKDIIDKTRKQRDEEMLMLKNRFLRTKQLDDSEMDRIETEIDHDEPTSEDSPLMGAGDHRAGRLAPGACPRVLLSGEGESEADAVVAQPNKRRSSADSPQVLSVLEDVKRIRVTAPKDGKIYPGLSDIEAPTTEDEAPKGSYLASLNTSSDSAANEKPDDWGNTSFSRDILKAVGVKKANNSGVSKGRKALRAIRKSRETAVNRSREDSDESSSDGENNQDLDDLLDEVLDADDDTEGPTPPKQNKNIGPTLTSTSFHYKKGVDSALSEASRFKSPLKTPPKPAERDLYQEELERNKPLVHTVSFYRKSQQISLPSTPVRVVRNEDPQHDWQAEAEAKKRKAEKMAAVDARQRVKELLEEVAKQNTVISQASQALNLCASTIEFSGSTEQAEGERLLLLATHRRQACLYEVQRIQVEGAPPTPGPAICLTIQDFCLPLRRDYVRQLNSDGALGHYLVCLVKCQERVIATSMARTTPDSFSVSFPDKVRLEGLSSDFKVTVEVYALQASKELLPHDIKYHINTKKGGKLTTPRKGGKGADLRAVPLSSPGGPSAVRAPALQPHGYCIFGHSQVSRTSFSLNKACQGGPLEGTVRVNLVSDRQPVAVAERPPLRGFLTMFQEAGGFGAWHRRWCVLHNRDLSYWKYPDHEGAKAPIGTIELATCVSERVTPAPRDLCARKNTLLLQTSVPGEPVASPRRRSALCLHENGTTTHLLASDTLPERDQWMAALNLALDDIKAMAE